MINRTSGYYSRYSLRRKHEKTLEIYDRLSWYFLGAVLTMALVQNTYFALEGYYR